MDSPKSKAPRTVRSHNGRFRNNRKFAIAPVPLENGTAPNKEQHHKMCHHNQRQNSHNNQSSPKSIKGRTGRCNNANRKSNSRSPRYNRKDQNHQQHRHNLQPSPEEQSKYLALDCEMVGVGLDGLQSALARVVIVDWSGSILLDKFVQVDQPIADYRTFVSGITAQDLQADHAISFDECRGLVATMLRGKILVGHALKNDLAALRIHHPWQDTRDTAKYEPFMKTRFHDGVLWPRRLRDLANERLGRDIQLAGQCHSPIEDAVAALDLYKCERAKWEKVMNYKIKKTNEIMRKQKMPLQSSKANAGPTGAQQIAVVA